MKQILLLLTLTLSFYTFVFAGPIYDDFKQTQEAIAKDKLDPAKLKKQLDANILSSMKYSLSTNYNLAGTENIVITDIQYEVSENENFTYYVKYKDFIGYVTYFSDPNLFAMLHSKEEIVLKPGVEIQRRQSILPPTTFDAPVANKTENQPLQKHSTEPTKQ